MAIFVVVERIRRTIAYVEIEEIYMKSLKRRKIYRKQEIEKVRRTTANRMESNHRFIRVFGNSEVVHLFFFTLRVVALCVGLFFVRCELTICRNNVWSVTMIETKESIRSIQSIIAITTRCMWMEKTYVDNFSGVYSLSYEFIYLFFFAFSYTNILRINYLLFVSFNNEINDFYFVFISQFHFGDSCRSFSIW